MLAGLLGTLGRIAGGTRGALKMAAGLNPNQPFDMRSWIHQWFQGGGGMSDARSAGASAGARPSLMDQGVRSAPQQQQPQRS